MNLLIKLVKWIVILAVMIGIAVWVFLTYHPVWGGKPDAASLAKIQASKHYDGTQFQNLEKTPLITSEEPLSLWQWAYNHLTTAEDKNPNAPLPTVKLDNSQWQNGSVAWLGHSTTLFKTGGKQFITDPVFYRASPVPFTGEPFAMTNKPVIDDLPNIDVVLISHDHYDHLDYQTIKEIVAKGKAKQFIVPLGVKAHLVRWGVPAERITELDWEEQTNVGDIAITFVPARHFSGREMNVQNPTLWGGYVVKSPDLSLYFSADSGYGKHYAEIIAKYAPFDFVMIENGAYDPKWALIHEMPEQGVQALKDIHATKAMPIHWGKFDLANHPWKEPIERFTKAANEAGFDIATPQIGEVFHIHGKLPQTSWWESVK
ncbi:MBL fold metallo-hydrolase [Rodentibacter trehalosifermentans]|uniref:MBL fold metallo-hydrolase n=1 Tax=Rodentibacter trehalosifermentans TaxID=1908263 RepID=UPI00098415E1|nr:MBL fold metallo-hydrolase [Rodentibacter trehalosifermentans]OOF52171.1 multidrug transporter [Rodentibacter trehalosifermentans]